MDKEQAIEVLKAGKITDNLTLIVDLTTSGFSVVNIDTNSVNRVKLLSNFTAKAYVSKYLKYKIGESDLAHYLPKFQTTYKPKEPFGALTDIDFNVHSEPEVESSVEGRIHSDIGKYFLYLFGDKEGVEYALQWLANLVQGNKNETAILLHGKQGGGKGTLFHLVSALIGRANTGEFGEKSLTGNHNKELAYKRFIHFNELNSYGHNQSVNNLVKTIVTDRTIAINPKGKDLFEVENLASFMFSSNSATALKVPLDDRRMNVFEQKNPLKEIDPDLLIRLYKLIDDVDEMMKLKKFLLNLDLSEWDSRSPLENESRRKAMMTTATKKEWLIHTIKDENGRNTKDLYFDDVLNLSDSDELDYNNLTEDDYYKRVIAKTEYAKHSPKVADLMIRSDFDLLYTKGILTSRYGALLYRVATDDLNASVRKTALFYTGQFTPIRPSLNGDRVRGYKVR
jgi:hypothetical protein